MTDSALDLAPGRPPLTRLWRRSLDRYPATGPRLGYLAIVVMATVALHYALYVHGAVATRVIAEYDLTLRYFVTVAVAGNAAGALAAGVAWAAGLADRWGRANVIVGSLLVTALIILFGLPHVPGRTGYLVLFSALSFVEGVALVATAALTRDFSPRLGRATAMGCWALGPALGSLLVTTVASRTVPTHPDWRFQFTICGLVGLGVFVVALLGLRELSPRLRNQMMSTLRERALLEARAASTHPSRPTDDHRRRTLRRDIVGPALGISAFLVFSYFAAGLFVAYFATRFGYSEARANALATWYWVATALALVVAGVASDAFRVRKPFLILGGLISAGGVAVFALRTTEPETGYYTFAVLLVGIGVGGGIVLSVWMAAFTETVERRDPAATATGLAVWVGALRGVVAVSLVGLIVAVPSANALVDRGPRLQEIAARYPAEFATAAELSPPTADALARYPDAAVVETIAVAELTGLPVTTVGPVLMTQRRYAQELETYLAAVPRGPGRYWLSGPNDPNPWATFLWYVAGLLDVDTMTAQHRLNALDAVYDANFGGVAEYGEQVTKAVARLAALSAIPADDLAYLREHGPDVAQALRAAPHEWQRWWWIVFAGQLVFLPSVFLLAGRWNPARAMREAERHEQAVVRELAALRTTGG
ncbi:MFS transporter [Cryptosporangium minutisporangium]|uniref:Major facilitator superfamily (MFS) profile domain-containing protein n=1 Tax=Cryptosporangium minutisporangium TaxID=113569 RepID=A0ABP6SQ91_9ACTN